MPLVAPEAAAPVVTKLVDPSGAWTGWVSVEEQPVDIYKVEHTDKKTKCYIEAREGKEFVVHFSRRHGGPTDLVVDAKIDGSRVDGFSLRRNDPTDDFCKFEGARISNTAIRPFCFTEVALTDDADSACQTEAVVKNLGTIQLDIHRTRILSIKPSTIQYEDTVKQPLIDEKAKKATMSHSTAFGISKPSVAASSSHTIDWIDRVGSPVWTLEFKYRSRALLEIEGLVKTVVEPSPPPADARAASASASASGSGPPAIKTKEREDSTISLSDSDYDDEDDLRAKVARLEAENSKLRGGGVKSEEDDVKPVVKGERIGKTSKDKKGRTVIDLLDESD